jgi:hypothetical protein
LNTEISALKESVQNLGSNIKRLNQDQIEQNKSHEKELKALNNQLVSLLWLV